MGSLVDGSYAALVQGVSQQAPQDRLDGQHTLQENFSNDPEKGLQRRPGTDWIDTIGSPATAYVDVEIDNVPYILAFRSRGLTVFGLDGVQESYVIDETEDPLAYLNRIVDPAVVSADGNVYICNPAVTTRMSTAVSASTPRDGVFYLLGGNYAKNYTVTIAYTLTSGSTGTIEGTYLTEGGNHDEDYPTIQTTWIAGKLLTALSTDDTNDYFTYKQSSEAVLVYASTQVKSFTITTSDDAGGDTLIGLTNRVSASNRLPRLAPHGMVVKIEGAKSNDVDDWYVKFDQDNRSTTNLGEGVWLECVAPGVPYQFNLTTMPIRLFKNADGDLQLSYGEWADRTVGDDDTNPLPTFIGNPIQDMAIFQSRLVFLSGSSVILSRTQKYTEFWKNSATQLEDDDVIDISSSTLRSAPIMRRAIPHNYDLVIFADAAQFIVFGRSAITPQTATLVLTTTYEANTDARPKPAGRSIFYAIDYGAYSGIKEFYTDGNLDVNSSRPVTGHCTRYIEGRADYITASTNFDMMLVHTKETNNKLYCYEYTWINDNKAQSAWSTWTFPLPVLFCAYIRDQVYIVLRGATQAILIKMDMDRPALYTSFPLSLDLIVPVTRVTTSFTVPEALAVLPGVMYIQGAGCPEPGQPVPEKTLLVDPNDDLATVDLEYSMNRGTVLAGCRFLSRVQLTAPQIRDANNEPVVTGALTIHHYDITCIQSGEMTCLSGSPFTDDNMTYTFGPRVNGNNFGNYVGVEAVDDYRAVYPAMADTQWNTLTISSDEHTPLRITNISWKGDYNKHGHHLS